MSEEDRPEIPQDTYESLMRATFRAVQKHGYANLRMKHIGEEFEKSYQLVHHYYGGKDELISALFEHLLTTYRQDLTVPKDASGEEKLNLLIDHFLYGPEIEYFDHREFMSVIFDLQAQARFHPNQQRILNEYLRRIEAVVMDAIEDGVRDGSFREVNVELSASAIWNVVAFATQRQVLLGQEEAPDQARDMIEGFILPRLRR